MDTTNENVVIQATELKEVTFNSVLAKSWLIFKSLFKEQVLQTILVLIALMIPILNFLTIPFLVIIVGKKINGEENPFTGAFKLYFSKFWRMFLLGFVYIGMLIWKILKWIIIPVGLWAILSIISLTFSVKLGVVNFISPVLGVAIAVISMIMLYKYMFGWMFSLYTVLFEDKKNRGALNRSWEMTMGNKWNIFFFISFQGLLTSIPAYILILIVVFLFRTSHFQVVQYIIQSPVYLFTFTFMTCLYFVLKENVGSIKLKITGWMRGIIITLLVLIPIGIMSSVVLVSLNAARQKAENAKIEMQNKIDQMNLEAKNQIKQ